MKKIIPTLILALAFTLAYGQTTHTISAAGNAFSPDSLLVNVGDTVVFNVGAMHPTVQTSLNTWNANGTTPQGGGFNFQSGNGSFVVTNAQVYYYVCQAHVVPDGMKGRIFAQNVSAVKELQLIEVEIFPNPVGDELVLKVHDYTEISDLRIVDLSGKLVKQLDAGSESSDQSFDVSTLTKGNYILIVKSGNDTKEMRFVKK